MFFSSHFKVSALSPFIKFVNIDWRRWVILLIVFSKLLWFWSSIGRWFIWIVSSYKERLLHQIFWIMCDEYLFWVVGMFLFLLTPLLLLFPKIFFLLSLNFYLIYLFKLFIFSFVYLWLDFLILLVLYFVSNLFLYLLLFFGLYFSYFHLFDEALPNRLLQLFFPLRINFLIWCLLIGYNKNIRWANDSS